MNVLLDTHTAIWVLTDNQKKLSTQAHRSISRATQVFMSTASAWELAIKVGNGKLNFEGGAKNFIQQLEDNGVLILPIRYEHIIQAESLPHHHRDPFDRLLVATAMHENLTIITADQNIPAYGVPVIW